MAIECREFEGKVEIRESAGSPGRLVGMILPAGRVAGDRRELFVGAGVRTPSNGIALLPEHRSKNVIMRFDPIRGADGSSEQWITQLTQHRPRQVGGAKCQEMARGRD